MKINDLKRIIDLDGSYGSGGGQILRTALALSLLTQKPFRLFNIRAKRKNPGLAAQHLTCIKVAKELSNAKVQNVFIGSKEIVFIPDKFNVKELSVDIGTAGSIALVLQTLMPVLLEAENFKAILVGGTDVPFAPPIDWIKHVLLRLLNKIGYDAEIKIEKRGFWPKGGGKVIFNFSSSKFKIFDFIERGKLINIKGNSVASLNLKNAKVAERMANFAIKWIKANENLRDLEINLKHEYVDTYSDGAILTLWLNTSNSVLGASSLGERGKPSEVVAREAVENLVKEIKGAIDSHATDQILPYLAWLCFKFKKAAKIKTSFITNHTETNAWTIQKFLPIEISIEKNIIKIKNFS